MEAQQFIAEVVRLARSFGFKIEVNRNGRVQIDFGNKKVHSNHLDRMFPCVFMPEANLAELIEAVAPVRPCTHRPMRQIIQQIRGGN